MSLAAALLLLTAPATTAPAPPSFAGFRAIPFASSRIGLLTLKGEINGRPVDILLDSGSSRTIVDRAWAARQGFAVTPLKESAYGAGGALTLSIVRDARLTIGGQPVARTPVYAVDLGAVIAGLGSLGTAAPQMILGGDVLKRHRALIDYGSNRLWLAPAN